MVTKRNVRQRCRAAVIALSATERQRASESVVQQILSLPLYQQAQHIALYASDGTEVDLGGLFAAAVFAGKICFFPRVHDEHLVFYAVNNPAELAPGYRGVQEPADTQQILDPSSCDLICVPGVAFDRQGGRLGRGKGFYDRYLPQVRGCRLGVSFDVAVVPAIPMESWDVSLDMLVSENGIVQCAGTEWSRRV